MASHELAMKLLDLAEPLVDPLVEHEPAARNAIYEALDSSTGYVASPGFDEKWRLTAAAWFSTFFEKPLVRRVYRRIDIRIVRFSRST